MARKILLADDSVTAQNMGRKILVDAGYEVVTVNNGSAALKRVNDLKPDIIVLDVYMPGYSGLEVCQRLKEASETTHIPVLLTVGKLEPFKVDEARRVRADGHIIKPFEASELLSALARMEDRIALYADGPDSKVKVDRFGADGGKKGTSEPDNGWTSRLRFPGKKKNEKEGKETADEAEPSFRDFRQGKRRAGDEVPVVSAAPSKGPELIPEVPSDITPEELDTLSALAAQVNPPSPDEQAAASDETVNPPEAAKLEEPAAIAQTGPVEAETTRPADIETMKAALFAQQPAPIDRDDEPIFAVSSFATPHEEASHQKPSEAAAPEAPVTAEAVAQVENPAPGEEASEAVKPSNVPENDAATPEAPVVRASADEFSSSAAATAQAADATEQESSEAIGPAPSEEELAEALRLLTPATAHAEAAIPSQEVLVAAGRMLAEEAARGSAAPRWVAEAVALTPEEASMSLEAEMFRTFVSETLAESAPAPITTKAAASAAAEWVAPIESLQADGAGAGAIASFAPEANAGSEAEPAASVAVEAVASSALDGNAISTVETNAMVSTTSPESSPEPAQEASPVATAIAAVAGQHAPAISAAIEQYVESAKNAEAAHETPRMMAAAASAESTSASAESASAEGAPAPPESAAAAAADPAAIASIVESVLADLRPKIVEEIAKKLSGK